MRAFTQTSADFAAGLKADYPVIAQILVEAVQVPVKSAEKPKGDSVTATPAPSPTPALAQK